MFRISQVSASFIRQRFFLTSRRRLASWQMDFRFLTGTLNSLPQKRTVLFISFRR